MVKPGTSSKMEISQDREIEILEEPCVSGETKIERTDTQGLKMYPDQESDDYCCRKSQASDLRVQLDVFDDQRETDEELSNHGPPGIDLSSHVDVFYAILGQVRTISRCFYEHRSRHLLFSHWSMQLRSQTPRKKYRS